MPELAIVLMLFFYFLIVCFALSCVQNVNFSFSLDLETKQPFCRRDDEPEEPARPAKVLQFNKPEEVKT